MNFRITKVNFDTHDSKCEYIIIVFLAVTDIVSKGELELENDSCIKK